MIRKRELQEFVRAKIEKRFFDWMNENHREDLVRLASADLTNKRLKRLLKEFNDLGAQ